MAEDPTTNDSPEAPAENASAPDPTRSTSAASPPSDDEHGAESERADTPDANETDTGTTGAAETETTAPRSDPYRIAALNRQIEGRLELTYPTRTVVVRCDGDAALRVLALLAGCADAGVRDHLDPFWSSAATGWIVLEPEVLAAVWEPTFGDERPTTRQRIVVDPLPAGLHRATGDMVGART